jgi:serine phosphatase RsbU (regulator of sigma subunit)
MKRGARGTGMALKFAILMIILVILIVAGVSVPLLLGMIPREQRMLAFGLQNRATILLESIAARASEPIREGLSGYAIVSLFPQEISTMLGEAEYITISGPGDPALVGAPAEDPENRDYLWATNDPEYSGTAYSTAEQVVRNSTLSVEKSRDIARSVNAAAKDALQGLPVTGGTSDQQAKVGELLQSIAADTRHTGSIPTYDPDALQDSYLFYVPLVTPDEAGGFFGGMVRLRVTTAKVQAQVTSAANSLLRTAGLIALAAIAIGVAGAILLANIAILPIGRLVKAVARISSTEDKASLGSDQIPVRARDEIGTLAETVNEMTSGLVKAAIAEKEMLVGRAIQKQFLPLEVGPDGEKGSTAGVKTPSIDLYAYYEGAAKVSGDYFDWQKLDDRYFAIIKCDVSGHGVEAAFIMVEVATLFLRWCREWKSRLADPAVARDAGALARLQAKLLHIETLAYTINDMIEERKFKDKFAALMLCVYDTQSGLVTACSAGDNVLYRFEKESTSILTQEIKPEKPAVGNLPSDMIAGSPGRYQTVQMPMGHGDVLILFTDGFEDAKRLFRNADGKVITCDAPGLKDEEWHLGTHQWKKDHERMSVSRILGVFDAYFKRTVYRLERHHLAAPETLEFDFRERSDSPEEAVLALVAVERVYRTYRDPQTSAGDRIMFEAKVDDYLQKHFRQYASYFGKPAESGALAEYRAMAGIKEDTQVDDLTVVLLRRP